MHIDIDFLPAISKVVAPQYIAMEDFRKLFHLVAGCKVSKDGKIMTYDFKTMSAAHSELSTANSIIIANKLPLVAGVRSVMNGKEAVSIQLRIVYKPQ